MKRFSRWPSLWAVALLCGVCSAHAAAPTIVKWDIAPQSVDAALNEFARQSGLQVVLQTEEVRGITSKRVAGRLTPQAALTQMLADTGLAFEYLNDRTVAVRPKGDRVSSNIETATGGGGVQLVQAQSGAASNSSADTVDGSSGKKSTDAQEIVVTGTHIRGAGKPSSPVHVFTREEIDRMGAGSVQDFVQRLPQNFGSVSESTVGLVAGGRTNVAGGTGLNLRGLGTDSSLVLLDGRRLAPGNAYGDFVDVGLIPLSAIERIEIVPDGASAIYGSDAVGGVANFIMRRDFDGAETRLRYGSVDKGERHELTAAQTFGHGWSGGSALVSYQYSDQSSLSADDRSYTKGRPLPFDLLPAATTHGILISANQDVASTVNVFADTVLSQRSGLSYLSRLGTVSRDNSKVDAYNATFGARIALPRQTQLELSAGHSDSNTDVQSLSTFTTLPSTQTFRTYKSRVMTMEARLDGELWKMASSTVHYAVGLHYRDESFNRIDRLTGSRFEPDRNAVAAFAELKIPLVGPRPGSRQDRLQVSLADRQERYNDFGSSNNPQFGLNWSALESLEFRGTFGTSFKAPLLNDLDPVPSQAVSIPEFDPVTGQRTNVLLVLGGNPALQPEDAKTWTFGFDFHPQTIEGLVVSATYYKIHYTDRVADPGVVVPSFDALRNEAAWGPTIIQRNVPQSVIQQLAITPSFLDFCPFFGASCPLSSISVVVDTRKQNFSVVDTDGIDLSISYRKETGFAVLQGGIDATRILNYDTRFAAGLPEVTILNTQYNPVDLRVRTNLGFTRGSFDGSVFFNYTNSYKNTLTTPFATTTLPPSPISSWTTADVSLGYTFSHAGVLTSGLSIRGGANNLADKDPPVVLNVPFNNSYPLNYDGTNANPVGRFYYLQLLKRF